MVVRVIMELANYELTDFADWLLNLRITGLFGLFWGLLD